MSFGSQKPLVPVVALAAVVFVRLLPAQSADVDFRFEREFAEAEAARRYYCYRTFTIDVPEDGYYEFGVRQKRPAWNVRICLDDWQVLGTQPRQCGNSSRRSVTYTRLTRVRKLTKGRHLMDVFVNPTAYDYANSQITRLMAEGALHVGYTRLRGADPERETGFWFEARDDMVFEVGETLRLCAGSAANVPREHLFTVTRTDAADSTYRPYQQRMVLDAVVRRFEFPCLEEGAYEYTVCNEKGEVVDGPWAFVVVDPMPHAHIRQRPGAPIPPAAEHVVDTVRCDEPRGGAHSLRDGASASVVITNASGIIYRQPGPGGEKIWKNAAGAHFTKMDWFAYTLSVPRPGRPYVVRCTVPNDRSRYVTSYAIDRKTGYYNGWNLHAGCGPACGPTSYLSYFVWPNTDAIDVLFLNTTGGGRLDRRAAVVKVELLECPDGMIPALPEPFGGWQRGRDFGWQGEQGDLYVNERTMPPLWKGDDWIRPEMDVHAYHGWHDLMLSWRRFGEISSYRGDSLCSGPVFSYGMQLYQGVASRILYPGRDIHGKGHHANDIDQFDRDQFKLLLIEAGRCGVKFVADFMLYPPADEGRFWAEAAGLSAETNGICLSAEASGTPWRHWTGACVNNPAHPVYRLTAIRFCEELGRRYGKYPAFAGIRHRYWPHCVAGFEPWWCSARLGFDDFTVGEFAKAHGLRIDSVGTNAAAFASRRTDITNRFGKAWYAWRANKVFTLREEMLAALRRHAPQANLYVSETNGWNVAAGLDPTLYKGRSDLGFLPEQVRTYVPREGVELNNLDGHAFEGFDIRPTCFRHHEHGTNDFTTGAYPQGLCCNRGYRAHPYQLEAPAKALAQNGLKMLYAGGDWCLPPADEGLRAFVQVYRAIPELDYKRLPVKHGLRSDAPYAAYCADTKEGKVVFFVNVTDMSLRFDVRFSDVAAQTVNLTDGSTLTMTNGLSFVLPPFMPSVWRIKGDVDVSSLEVTIADRRMMEVQDFWQQIRGFEAQASLSGAKEVISSVCENRTRKLPADMVYGGADATYEWRELTASLNLAAQEMDWLSVDMLSKRLFSEHPWYFRLFGWPKDKDDAMLDLPDSCTLYKMAESASCPRFKKPAERSRFVFFPENDPAPGRRSRCPAYVSGCGKPIELVFDGWGGSRRVVVTARFGGGYGPLSVFVNGRLLWTFPAVQGKDSRWETRITPVSFPWEGAVPVNVSFVGEGGLGAAVLDASLANDPPQPVRCFCADNGVAVNIGKNRLIDVGELASDELSFWVRNTGNVRCTTAFVAGVEACELRSRGKTCVRRGSLRRPDYVQAFVDVPKGITRFDLLIDRACVGAKVGVAFFLAPGMEILSDNDGLTRGGLQ